MSFAPRTKSMYKILDIAKDSIVKYGPKKTMVTLPVQFSDTLRREKFNVNSPFHGMPFNKVVTIALYCLYFNEVEHKDILEIFCRENSIAGLGSHNGKTKHNYLNKDLSDLEKQDQLKDM